MRRAIHPYSRLALSRTVEALKLLGLVKPLVFGVDDQLDDLGLLRLAEIQIGQVRKAVVAEARMHGFTWQQLGDTLGMSAEDAERIYGRV